MPRREAGLRFDWFTPAAADPELQRAVDAARTADVAVVVGDDSTEGVDRPSTDLLGEQGGHAVADVLFGAAEPADGCR